MCERVVGLKVSVALVSTPIYNGDENRVQHQMLDALKTLYHHWFGFDRRLTKHFSVLL